MAKVVVLAPSQYLQGQVNLTKGDRWTLDFQVMQDYAGVRIPVDLSAASGVTGYFPTASGATGIACSVTDATNGYGRCVVTEAVTPSVSDLPDPTGWYVVATLTDGLQTIDTPDRPLIVGPRAFIST